jgi:hypothetical protein
MSTVVFFKLRVTIQLLVTRLVETIYAFRILSHVMARIRLQMD